MFVDKEPIPVMDEAGNAIYIRPKMSVGIKNRVISEAMKMELQGDSASGAMDIGAYQTALLLENITGWHGPAFVGRPFSKAALLHAIMEDFDPDDPMLARVLEEINDRNTPKNPAASENGQSDGTGHSEATKSSRKVKR